TIVIQKRTISGAARQIQGRNVRVDIGISLTMEFLPDWMGGSKKLLSARLSTDDLCRPICVPERVRPRPADRPAEPQSAIPRSSWQDVSRSPAEYPPRPSAPEHRSAEWKS